MSAAAPCFSTRTHHEGDAVGYEAKACSVPGCRRPAAFECRLVDVYDDGEVFDEPDFTCPFLCGHHQTENERRADGVREPRGYVAYPFTNRMLAQGYTTYRRLPG